MPLPRLSATGLAGALVIIACSTALGFESDRLTVTTVGEGRDVILVPGLNGSPAVWKDLTERLPNNRYHLVHVNGFAGAPAAANATGPVVAPVADEIARYIEESGIDDPVLIGHSMGGVVATLVAAGDTVDVDRLMVVDIPAYFGEIMGVPAEQIGQVAAQMRDQALARNPGERDAAELPLITAGILDETARDGVIADMRASDPAVGANAQYDIMVTDLRPLLPSIEAATTVVFVLPAQAPGMTPEQIEGFYAAQYAGAAHLDLRFVADSGHYVMLDQPEVFANLVGDLLD